MTIIPLQRNDSQERLLHDEEHNMSDNELHRQDGSNRRNHLWPKDIIGMNLEAKMGSVASERVSIRLAFLRKVFGILSFQVVLTTVICTAFYMTPGIREFIREQSWIVFPFLLVSLGLLIAMHFHAHSVPINYILLSSFTILQALTLGCIVAVFELQVILEAALLTAVIVFSLFIYTLQSRRDFIKHYALGFSFLGILLVASMMQLFFMSSAFNTIVNVIGAAIFCVFLVFDIDLIMNHLSPEDYILACITLYMDIINLFIRILQVLGEVQH